MTGWRCTPLTSAVDLATLSLEHVNGPNHLEDVYPFVRMLHNLN